MSIQEIIWAELTTGLPDKTQLVHTIIRLLAAALLGGLIGLQRQGVGKPAGVRTHILVASGAAVFVLAAAGSGMTPDAVSRVIQGLVTGIGFLGAGAILKRSRTWEIQGLTTAAGIWITAAIGVTVGLGGLGLALLGTGLTWLVLTVVGRLERLLPPTDKPAEQPDNLARPARGTAPG
ncbi:MgtC/SapB family protein [Hymenobacter sp. UV11]|jgi:putative Mg2+ transporter-C (MgtC) family protein|uniref:MgtC/SapB family protein n=1 Tax=Hymenobacter sp. UV11 TaxID=1849735 RepID=UPI00105D039B|nr:MgtC/SapB family protein [Hymenobacter sp. UV11]TDN39661.1 magnesium transporter MgtC [Hymenobacter sp. UV11]TFZ62074.1 MgtC/SapB family protein [Hymenobacter sp. UV11]